MPRVIVFGVATVDRILSGHSGWPAPGERQVATSLTVLPGGNALNAACHLGRLGVPTALRMAVGPDADGAFLAQTAAEHGVETGLVRCDAGAQTSTSLVFVDGRGEPSFLHFPGANATLGARDVRELAGAFGAADAVFIAGVGLLEGLCAPEFGEALAAALAGPRRPLVFADVNLLASGESWARHLAHLRAHLDYFAPNLAEALQITRAPTREEAGERLLAMLPRAGAVCIKEGRRGVTVFGRTGPARRVPAFDVPVADTIGAGDAWSAGFIAAMLRGGADPAGAAEFANAAAAHCVQHRGGTAGARSYEEIGEFIASGPRRAGA